jgi:hypothetical protein
MRHEHHNAEGTAEQSMTNVILNLAFVGFWVGFASVVLVQRSKVKALTPRAQRAPADGGNESFADAAQWTALDDAQLARLLRESSP